MGALDPGCKRRLPVFPGVRELRPNEKLQTRLSHTQITNTCKSRADQTCVIKLLLMAPPGASSALGQRRTGSRRGRALGLAALSCSGAGRAMAAAPEPRWSSLAFLSQFLFSHLQMGTAAPPESHRGLGWRCIRWRLWQNHLPGGPYMWGTNR